jgi:hypothetical protein
MSAKFADVDVHSPPSCLLVFFFFICLSVCHCAEV